jgi:hypothetical protein
MQRLLNASYSDPSQCDADMVARVSKVTVTESQNNRTIDWNNIIFKPNALQNDHSTTQYFDFPEKWLRNEYQKTKEDVWLAGF